MESNADILLGLDRQEEEFSDALVMHHPIFRLACYPPPSEPTYTEPIDITSFQQPHNINENSRGLDDIGEVNLPSVDKRLFENIALASIHPAPIIRAAISSEQNTSFFKLVQCSQANALIIFRTPAVCLTATNIAQFEIDWEDTSYTVSVAPHDMTDNRIRLDRGYLVNLKVFDFLVEFWFKEFVVVTFYLFGSVVLIDQISLTGADFSSLSLCMNLYHH
jgi:hypothetical protein